MIVFNTLKKAEHYVKWWNKKHAYHKDGYDWEAMEMFISGNRVIINHSGDGCGCGCDMYLFDHSEVVGRIKKPTS